MDWLVLVKVVPDADRVRYDPVRRTLVREGVELFANPFDQRAVRIALDRRAPGEVVTVVSMGPPNAADGLLESLALGVDRAILITDPALAGSDTLVTAHVLARASTLVGSDVILTGRWSTDSDTGQVPPQLAALLGRPFVAAARRLERVGDGRLEVEGDTETGSTRYGVPLPAVVSIGEKIAKLRKPTDAELATAAERGVERWSLARLGLDPAEVGEAGSPTVVGRLRDVAPPRVPRVFADGALPERVAAAREAIVELLRRTPPSDRAVSTPTSAPPRASEILVLVSERNGRLSTSARTVVEELRRGVPGAEIAAAWVGTELSPSDRRTLAESGIGRLLWVRSPTAPVEDAVAAAGVEGILARHPSIEVFVCVAGEFGRAVAGRVAADRSLGLIGDAVEVERTADGAPVFWKPAFGGGILAEVRSRTRPVLATLRPGSARPAAASDRPELTVERADVSLPASRLEILGETLEVEPGPRSPAEARLVVTVGMGVGGPDGVTAVRTHAESWGAAVVATRKVVDAGWVPRQLQVGLTGLALAPDLAILVGASARPNHLVGFRRARVVVSVNADRAAAEAAPVDVALVGRWEEVLPELTRQGGPWLRTVAEGSG